MTRIIITIIKCTQSVMFIILLIYLNIVVIYNVDRMSRVYLGRLSSRAQEGDLERFFRGFGKINDIMIKNGYAFIVSLSVN